MFRSPATPDSVIALHAFERDILRGMTEERFEVSRVVEAPPSAVFAVLRSPDGHVAIDSSGMLQSADGAPVEKVGDTFVVHMDRESLNDYPLGKYDVTVIITKYVEDAEIEWTIEGAIKPPLRHLYGYRVKPHELGSLVTSYYDWSQIDEQWRGKGIFPVIPESALRATLGVLARTVAPGKPRPSLETTTDNAGEPT